MVVMLQRGEFVDVEVGKHSVNSSMFRIMNEPYGNSLHIYSQCIPYVTKASEKTDTTFGISIVSKNRIIVSKNRILISSLNCQQLSVINLM